MIASMYQRGSSSITSGEGAAWVRVSIKATGSRWEAGGRSRADGEYVGGCAVRVHHHEIAPPAPLVAFAVELFVDGEGGVFRQPQRLEIESDPARLRIVRIEVHAGEDAVAARALRIAEELVVVGGVEGEAPVRLQGRVRVADGIEARDQGHEARGILPVPVLDLVFLAVEVFLAR